MTRSLLLSPVELRSLSLRNRLVVAPMCQYSATAGVANDWHFVHLGRFALGGFGMVMVEATGVSPEGRISPADLGLWNDEQEAALARIARFLKEHGAAPAIQLAHAGRKASTRKPWLGGGPLTESDIATHGEGPWQTVAPSAVPHREGQPVPRAADAADLQKIRDDFRNATMRALRAGFDVVEVHAAHGYLLNEFLSPIANRREDEYGGDLAGRMRFPLEIAAIVREAWPMDKPVVVRASAVDWMEGGLTVDETVAFARELKAIGIDVVHVTSGGIGEAGANAVPGYQVPFAAAVKAGADIATMAVGLIATPEAAEAVLAEGKADFIALARTALADPNFPITAERVLEGKPENYDFAPLQARHPLRGQAKILRG